MGERVWRGAFNASSEGRPWSELLVGRAPGADARLRDGTMAALVVGLGAGLLQSLCDERPHWDHGGEVALLAAAVRRRVVALVDKPDGLDEWLAISDAAADLSDAASLASERTERGHRADAVGAALFGAAAAAASAELVAAALARLPGDERLAEAHALAELAAAAAWRARALEL